MVDVCDLLVLEERPPSELKVSVLSGLSDCDLLDGNRRRQGLWRRTFVFISSVFFPTVFTFLGQLSYLESQACLEQVLGAYFSGCSSLLLLRQVYGW